MFIFTDFKMISLASFNVPYNIATIHYITICTKCYPPTLPCYSYT